MGLDRLHLLTTSGSYRLRLEWQESVTHYWFSTEYWVFYIDDEAANYTMHVDGYVHGDYGSRAVRVYPYPRVYPYVVRTRGYGPGRVHTVFVLLVTVTYGDTRHSGRF